jgi:hypothetical protein
MCVKAVSGEKIRITHVGWDPRQVLAYVTGATRRRPCGPLAGANRRCQRQLRRSGTPQELPTPSLACYTAQRLGVRVDGSGRLGRARRALSSPGGRVWPPGRWAPGDTGVRFALRPSFRGC